MAYTKVIETTLPGGKFVYKQSDILTNKLTELQNAKDVVLTNENLGNGTWRTTQVWRDEAAYNSFRSWLSSTGERAKIQAYHSANNITSVIY